VQVNLTRIELIVVGAADSDYTRLIADYERRLARYVRFAVRELKGEPLQRGADHVRRVEGERVLAALDSIAATGSGGNVTVAALAIEGTQWATPTFASSMLGKQGTLALVVGGAAGLSPEVLARADVQVSLGPLTLPHQLARLVLTEQLYRAYRIARNEPYHH
jgi:23S rRNA (pseudouridine1915-N3)-methyltransferase